jgi:hypothetical protein
VKRVDADCVKDFGRLAYWLAKLCVGFHYIRRRFICQTIKIKFQTILRDGPGGDPGLGGVGEFKARPEVAAPAPHPKLLKDISGTPSYPGLAAFGQAIPFPGSQPAAASVIGQFHHQPAGCCRLSIEPLIDNIVIINLV